MLTIGGRIKYLREIKGLSLDKLSKITGIKKSSLSNYENDKYDPSAQTIITLCKYFDVSADWLLTGCECKDDFNNFTQTERNIIEKFRKLDSRDQEEVKAIIDMKYDRITKKERLSGSMNGKIGNSESVDDTA